MGGSSPQRTRLDGIRYLKVCEAMRPMTGIDDAKEPVSRSPAGPADPPAATVRGDLRDTGSLAFLRRRGHRADADVDVRARHRLAHLGRHREVRRRRHGVRGRLARLRVQLAADRQAGGFPRSASGPAPAPRGVRRDHRAAHHGRPARPADLGLLRTGGDRGRDHAVAGRDGPGPLERPAGGLAPAARRVLVRVGRGRAVLRHRPGRRDAARDRGVPLLRRGRGGPAVRARDAVVRGAARHRARGGPARTGQGDRGRAGAGERPRPG